MFENKVIFIIFSYLLFFPLIFPQVMAEKQVKKTKRRRLDLNDVYEVERIVDHAPIENSRNKYLYFIKWKGWHQSHNTWEPLDNLNCDNKLNEYLSKLIVAPSDEKKIEEIKMSMMTLEEGYIKNLLSENKIDGKIQVKIFLLIYFSTSVFESAGSSQVFCMSQDKLAFAKSVA